MKELKCREVGGLCDFIASGETGEEAKQKLMIHGMEAHAAKMSVMSEDDKQKMMDKMDEMTATQE